VRICGLCHTNICVHSLQTADGTTCILSSPHPPSPAPPPVNCNNEIGEQTTADCILPSVDCNGDTTAKTEERWSQLKKRLEIETAIDCTIVKKRKLLELTPEQSQDYLLGDSLENYRSYVVAREWLIESKEQEQTNSFLHVTVHEYKPDDTNRWTQFLVPWSLVETSLAAKIVEDTSFVETCVDVSGRRDADESMHPTAEAIRVAAWIESFKQNDSIHYTLPIPNNQFLNTRFLQVELWS